MRQSVAEGFDDHPDDDDERPPTEWTVMLVDDCDGCDDLRIVLTLEPRGSAGTGVVAHLSTAGAARLRAALASALKQAGAPAD